MTNGIIPVRESDQANLNKLSPVSRTNFRQKMLRDTKTTPIATTHVTRTSPIDEITWPILPWQNPNFATIKTWLIHPKRILLSSLSRLGLSRPNPILTYRPVSWLKMDGLT